MSPPGDGVAGIRQPGKSELIFPGRFRLIQDALDPQPANARAAWGADDLPDILAKQRLPQRPINRHAERR
jgi:hypothetical protein